MVAWVFGWPVYGLIGLVWVTARYSYWMLIFLNATVRKWILKKKCVKGECLSFCQCFHAFYSQMFGTLDVFLFVCSVVVWMYSWLCCEMGTSCSVFIVLKSFSTFFQNLLLQIQTRGAKFVGIHRKRATKKEKETNFLHTPSTWNPQWSLWGQHTSIG